MSHTIYCGTLHRELSKQQIDTIKRMEPNQENKVITEINKYIQLSDLAAKQLEYLASKINPQSYDIEKIGKIVSNLNNDFLGREASKLFLAALTKQLVSKIDMKNFSFPLSKENANTIDSFINFRKYIDENKGKISISPETEELLNTQDLEKLELLLEDTHKVGRYNRLHDKASSAPSSVSKHLTQQEHSFLSLFDKIITHGNHSTSTEPHELSLMLEKCIGDMDFNKRLDLFNKEKNPLASAYKYTILDIKYFGFKAKSSSDANIALLDKCEKAIAQIEAGAVLSSKDQINLYELGRLEDLAKLKEKMDKYNELGLIEPSSKLSKLYEQVNRAAAIFEKIEEQQSSENTYKSGDILMTHSKKSLTVKNKNADNETALTHTFISKYGHATQIYIDPETEKPKLSHIYGGYQSDDVKAADVVMSEVFRVDPIKLIPADVQRKLEAYYKEQGLDYIVEVRKIFEQNVQDLHAGNQERFANISNDKSARFQAGLANFGLYGGHTSKESNDFGEVHKEMYGTGEKLTIRNKMICSEFVARSLVAALYETNEQLKEKLGEEATSVLRVPLAREHLSRIPPERLINLLQKEGCLEQVSSPSFLKKLVNHDDLTRKTDVSVKKPCQIFYEELVILAKTHEHDTPTFKIEATKAFKKYAEKEKLDLDLESPKMANFLDNSFSKMHSQINEKPSIIIQLFRNLKNLLGYKPEAQQTVEKTIRDLEKLQIDSIKHRYVDEPTSQSSIESSIAATRSYRSLALAHQEHEVTQEVTTDSTSCRRV